MYPCMFKSNLYPEIRAAKKVRVQDKIMQLFVVGVGGYLLGLTTIVWQGFRKSADLITQKSSVKSTNKMLLLLIAKIVILWHFPPSPDL